MCHIKEFGFHPEKNGRSWRDLKEGSDTNGFTFERSLAAVWRVD